MLTRVYHFNPISSISVYRTQQISQNTLSLAKGCIRLTTYVYYLFIYLFIITYKIYTHILTTYTCLIICISEYGIYEEKLLHPPYLLLSYRLKTQTIQFSGHPSVQPSILGCPLEYRCFSNVPQSLIQNGLQIARSYRWRHERYIRKGGEKGLFDGHRRIAGDTLKRGYLIDRLMVQVD